MRKISFLVPGTTERFLCGGLNVELQASRLLQEKFPNKVVTYRNREENHAYLDDELKESISQDSTIWIISWGHDIPSLIKKLKGRPIAYHAHSTGYNFNLPKEIPILAASKNTLGYWAAKAPRNPLFLIQNALEHKWIHRGKRAGNSFSDSVKDREIDVLVQTRKNSHYVINHLVPALKKEGLNVQLQSEWITDIVSLYNHSKVFIYDSTEYWTSSGLSEGFGLPPLEAIACGCVLFSSFNHALSDFLIPGRVGHQLGCFSLEKDIENIHEAVKHPEDWITNLDDLEDLMNRHSEEALLQSWLIALKQVDWHWNNVIEGKYSNPKKNLNYRYFINKARRFLKSSI